MNADDMGHDGIHHLGECAMHPSAPRWARHAALFDRVGTPISEGPSHRTVLVLFTYGSSEPQVCYPLRLV